jgi:hypothetical protein
MVYLWINLSIWAYSDFSSFEFVIRGLTSLPLWFEYISMPFYSEALSIFRPFYLRIRIIFSVRFSSLEGYCLDAFERDDIDDLLLNTLND